MSDTTGVLFVCLGNICRSPLAEGVFLSQARARGVADRFDVESCGIGSWHVGERPDGRAEAAAARHGVELPSRARQVDPERDFERFDIMLAMDASNRHGLIRLGAPEDRVRMLRSFDPALRDSVEREQEVPDPYYGGPEGFDRVFGMVEAACGGLLEELLRDRA